MCRRTIVQRGCGISIPGHTKNVMGHSPGLTLLEQGTGLGESQEVASSLSGSVVCLSFKVLTVHGTSSADILQNNPL